MSVKIQDILTGTADFNDVKIPPKYTPTHSLFKGVPTDREDDLSKGNEAIDFNISSKFVKELVAALDAGMKHRDSVLQEKLDLHPDIDRVTLVSKAKNEMRVYTNDVLIPAMKKIILEHTGIRLTKVVEVATEFGTPTPSMMFAIDISFNDSLSTIESIVDTITGQDAPTGKPAKYAEVYNELAAAWSSGDVKLSKPKKEVLQKVFKKLDLATTMYFDYLTTFFAHFYVSKQEAFPAFTAREIAAIVVHEVGHVHTLVERTADDFYRKKYTEVAVSDLINSRDTLETKFDLIDEIVEHHEKTVQRNSKKSKDVDTNTESKVQNLLYKSMKAFSEKRESLLKQVGENTSGGVGNALADFLWWMLNLWIYSYMTISTIVTRIFSEISVFVSIYKLGKDRSSRKHGDTVYTTRNEFALETWADEFAVRLGLGAELNSAFSKMTILGRIYSQRLFYTDSYLSGFKDTWFYFLYSKFIYASNTISFSGDKYAYLGHENTPDRVKSIERLMIDYFKTNRSKFDPKMMDQMIADFEKAVASTKKINNPGLFYKIVDLLAVVAYHLSTPTVVLSKLFKVCSKAAYYNDLQDAINVIENNKMFYHKAKLDQIARKFDS